MIPLEARVSRGQNLTAGTRCRNGRMSFPPLRGRRGEEKGGQPVATRGLTGTLPTTILPEKSSP